ncbi:hypothetical protein [Streptomyces sp. NPDC048481]|uniref:hypothetical protein n=1 Tax=Streptomyces sp. NPDC048481 TaxID=3365557 RepID=UPI003713978E
MKSGVVRVVPHANARNACSAHGVAAGRTPLVADVVLCAAGSDHVEWAVCARRLEENPDAVGRLREHPAEAAAPNRP